MFFCLKAPHLEDSKTPPWAGFLLAPCTVRTSIRADYRPYDRSLVSNTFTIDQGILEKTLEFTPGEWFLPSYIATGMENVPIFIKVDNAEEEIVVDLRNHT